MGTTTTRAVAGLLGIAVTTVPLAGCVVSGTTPQAETNGDEAMATYEKRAERIPAGNPDSTTWKTLGDAFAAADDDPSYGYDEQTYVGVVPAGGRRVYVAARMTPEAYGAVGRVDVAGDDFVGRIEAALSGLAVTKVEDITDKVVSQTDLERLVGKTGRNLEEDGYRFASSSAYGGDSTTATFDKGYFGYEFTFSKEIPESVGLEGDAGTAVRDATITGVRSSGNLSLAALDPTKAGRVEEQDAAPEPFVSAIAAPPGSVVDPSAIPHTEPETETK